MSVAGQIEKDEPQGAAGQGIESRGSSCQEGGSQDSLSGAAVQNAAEGAPKGPVDLNGEFRFKVDGKGRVSLPAKFRRALSKDLVVTRDLEDECLYVFETPEFNAWINRLFEERFGGYKASSRQHVAMRRKLKGRARDVEVDASGRIMLTGELREAVGIDKDVVMIGNTGYFEIWDAKRYEQVDEETDLSLFYS